MIPSNDILGRRDEIKDFLAASEMEKALKRLIDFIRDFCPDREDEVILLSMDYHELEKELRMELVAYQDGKVIRRKLAFRMLGTLKSAINATEAA